MASWTSGALAFVQIALLFSQLLNFEHWEIQECSMSTLAGETCYLHLDQVRPGQLAVGKLEVLAKKNSWENLSASQLITKKWNKQPPIIIGPRGFQLIDNHHHARALFDSSLPNSEKWMYFKIFRNWSDRSLDRYDFSMFSETFLWPYDEKGLGPVDPALFPRSLGDLLDDPFRSLAYLVRSRGGFLAVHLPFQEFRWANFFRNHLHDDLIAFQQVAPGDEPWCRTRPYSTACLPSDAQKVALESLLTRALELAASSDAAHLPGYISPTAASSDATQNQENISKAVDTNEIVAGISLEEEQEESNNNLQNGNDDGTGIVHENIGGRSLVNNHTRREKARTDSSDTFGGIASSFIQRVWESSS